MVGVACAVFFSLLVAGCGCRGEECEIRANAQGYLDATGNYLIDEARPYATQETLVTLDALNMLMQVADTTYILQNQPATITILSVDRVNDTEAVVTYRKQTPIKDITSTLDMRRRDEGWRALVLLKERCCRPWEPFLWV